MIKQINFKGKIANLKHFMQNLINYANKSKITTVVEILGVFNER